MLDFKAMAKESENKVHFVYNFLAVLEMLQQELIDIQIGLGYNNFWISPKERFKGSKPKADFKKTICRWKLEHNVKSFESKLFCLNCLWLSNAFLLT
jgi:hypothetical protein